MIVVADTSPLNYLVQIDEIELLPALYARVLVPESAMLELMHVKASPKVQIWASDPPSWVEVCPVGIVTNSALLRLDIGEREAIQLALDRGVGTVLMDETDGRREAEMLQLEVRGTLGVLERGARLGRTDFRAVLVRLERTNFRVSTAVRTAFLLRNP